jgi:hypothetical protein
MFRFACIFSLLVAAAACLGQLGCTKATVDPALLAQHKEKFTLADEPTDVQTVFEVRELLLGHTEEGHDHEHAEGEAAEEHDHAGETAEEHAAHEHEGDDHSHEGETAEEHAAHTHQNEVHSHEGETAEEHAAHAHEHDHEHVFPTEAKEVAMVGQVGGLANPWEETQPEFPFATHFAVFFLADPQAIAEHAEEGHVHAPGEECAFCAAHAEENSELFAMVRLVDDSGKVLPIDVREFIDVNENDTVVVKGTAQIVEGGMLVVKASGLYVRK